MQKNLKKKNSNHSHIPSSFFYFFVSQLDHDHQNFTYDTEKAYTILENFRKGINLTKVVELILNFIKEKLNLDEFLFIGIPNYLDEYNKSIFDYFNLMVNTTRLSNSNGFVQSLKLDQLITNDYKIIAQSMPKELKIILFTDLLDEQSNVFANVIKNNPQFKDRLAYCLALCKNYNPDRDGYNPIHPISLKLIRDRFIIDDLRKNLNNEFPILKATKLIKQEKNNFKLDNMIELMDVEEVQNDQESNKITSSSGVTFNLRSLYVGSVIILGSYNHNPIEWQVIGKKKNDHYLLISKYSLITKEYNKNPQCASWQQSSLRFWLNEIFYKLSFSSDEKQYIKKQQVSVEEGDPDSCVYDYVSILSKEEYQKYFSKIEEWKNILINTDMLKQCWLRDLSRIESNAMFIGRSGRIHEGGSNITSVRNSVRPIICIGNV